MPTALLGYSPLYGVFTAWDASLHFESGYSKNLQFKEELLEDCIVSGWAVGDQGGQIMVSDQDRNVTGFAHLEMSHCCSGMLARSA